MVFCYSDPSQMQTCFGLVITIVQCIFLQQCTKQSRKKYLNKSTVAFSLPNSSRYMLLIFPKKNSLLSLYPNPQKPIVSLTLFLLGRRDPQTYAIINLTFFNK